MSSALKVKGFEESKIFVRAYLPCFPPLFHREEGADQCCPGHWSGVPGGRTTIVVENNRGVQSTAALWGDCRVG